jgi:hypothetical protein
MLSVIMISVIALNVDMLRVIRESQFLIGNAFWLKTLISFLYSTFISFVSHLKQFFDIWIKIVYIENILI